MKGYIGIFRLGNNTKIPVRLTASSQTEAIIKIAEYCKNEGYSPVGIEVIEMLPTIGMIEI